MKNSVEKDIAQDLKRLDAAKARMRQVLASDAVPLGQKLPTAVLLGMAADEIEALRQRVAQIEKALDECRRSRLQETPWQVISDVLYVCGRAGIELPVRFVHWCNTASPWADAATSTAGRDTTVNKEVIELDKLIAQAEAYWEEQVLAYGVGPERNPDGKIEVALLLRNVGDWQTYAFDGDTWNRIHEGFGPPTDTICLTEAGAKQLEDWQIEDMFAEEQEKEVEP